MVRHHIIPTLALAATLCLNAVYALNPITIKGTKFFDSVTLDQFFIKGVAYQPRTLTSDFSDPLAKPIDCKRDFALMKELGLNTVRVYQVDPSLNHEECMKAMEDAGLYLVLDLAATQHSIIRDRPEYNIQMWDNVRNTVDAFKGYSNTLGFFAGNEVTNDKTTTAASAYVKALLRDTKRYIASNAPRRIPVGYANNDDPDIRLQVQDYFNCGNEDERIDFFGINLYEWCGSEANYANSGYADRTADIASYSVPVFLSEFGCNLVSPRTFSEVASIFGPDMTNNWSGGIVYEWSQEANNYGLVQIQADNSVAILPDYNNLKSALAPLQPVGVRMDAFNEQKAVSSCPDLTATWEPSSILPPTPSSTACDCMMSSLSCSASQSAMTAPENLGPLLNTVCGMVSCDDIGSDAKSGSYGKYSFCSASQKLSYMYNLYYSSIGNSDPATCSFNGMAVMSANTPSSAEACAATGNQDPVARTSSFKARENVGAGLADKSTFGLFVVMVVMAAIL